MKTENVDIVAYLDNNKEKQQLLYHGKKVYSLQQVASLEYKYIVIAIVKYDSCITQLSLMNISTEKIIPFYSYELINKERYSDIFDLHKWEINAMQQVFKVEIKKLRNEFEIKFNNIGYEIAESLNDKKYLFPNIESSNKALEKIIKDKCSICRFGDGEFEMMREKKRPKFQLPDKKLAMRLKEIVKSNDEKILIGLANNYGSLAMYTEEAANGIRKYLTPDTRTYHMSVIDLNKTYYDAYLSRPYIIYRDKQAAKSRFELLKKIWDHRTVTIIEGDRSRLGENNDLLHNTKAINRMRVPSMNAFLEYDNILKKALQIDRNELILISLGPTATVLAYDLACVGYQAIDIGQIDNEYDWFLRKAEHRTLIEGKYVSEISSIS